MMAWPATPDKKLSSASSSNSKTTGPSTERSASSNGKQNSLYEPSPVTTYGETNTRDSVPATPTDLDDSSALIQSFCTVELKGDRYKDTIENPTEQSYASALPGHSLAPENVEGKLQATSLQPKPLSSSSSAQLYTNLVPKNALRRSVVRENSWRQREVDFVLPSNDSDPFYVKRDESSTSNAVISDSTAGIEDNSDGDPTTYHPREDREVAEISGDNAQALFPPNACVFVANLVATLADEQLEYSVSRAFEQFGKVYVKIKRDARTMPYAFCQYENVADSERAIQYGRGMMIDGRQCRTERAKVNRSLYLSRTTGGAITDAEAREILAGRGDLEKVWLSSPTDKEMFRLPEGIWIMFAFFQDCRDAQALFKDNPDYRLEQPALPEDIRARLNRSFGSPVGKTMPVRGYASSPIWQMRHLAERTSIFVGNLPPNVSQTQLRVFFATCGNIRAVEIISRPSFQGTNIFAFIEFNSEEEARRATTVEHILDGFQLRIELRESPDHFPSRNLGHISAGSPRARGVQSSPDISRNMITRETAVARAISAGIHPSAAIQIFDPQRFEGNDTLDTMTMAHPIYPQIPYFTSFYSPQYGPYGASTSATDSEQNSNSMYRPLGHVHYPMSHYPYPPFSGGQYHTDYPIPSPYAFHAPIEANPAVASSSSGQGDVCQ